MTHEKLIDEIRTLELEVQKLELEKRIAELKAKQLIDENPEITATFAFLELP